MHGSRPLPDLRRDVREDPLRGPPHLPGVPRRDVRSHDHGARVLEDVRDDGLADRLARGGEIPPERNRQGPGADDHVRPRLRAAGREGGPHGADGPRREDGRGVSGSAGHRLGGALADSPAPVVPAGGSVLLLPAVRRRDSGPRGERASSEGGTRRRPPWERLRAARRRSSPNLVRCLAGDDSAGDSEHRSGSREALCALGIPTTLRMESAVYWTIWVSPQFGHITSIGRLLVVISIGAPHALHVTLIGAGPGIAVAGGGGREIGRAFSEGARGASPGSIRRHIRMIMMNARMTNSPRTTTIAGTPATSVHRGFTCPIVTPSTAKAPVAPSWTVMKTWPVFAPAGIVYVRSPRSDVVCTVFVGAPGIPIRNTKLEGNRVLPRGVSWYVIRIVSPGL